MKKEGTCYDKSGSSYESNESEKSVCEQSPACKIQSQVFNMSNTSGRNKLCVSDMIPILLLMLFHSITVFGIVFFTNWR